MQAGAGEICLGVPSCCADMDGYGWARRCHRAGAWLTSVGHMRGCAGPPGCGCTRWGRICTAVGRGRTRAGEAQPLCFWVAARKARSRSWKAAQRHRCSALTKMRCPKRNPLQCPKRNPLQCPKCNPLQSAIHSSAPSAIHSKVQSTQCPKRNPLQCPKHNPLQSAIHSSAPDAAMRPEWVDVPEMWTLVTK